MPYAPSPIATGLPQDPPRSEAQDWSNGQPRMPSHVQTNRLAVDQVGSNQLPISQCEDFIPKARTDADSGRTSVLACNAFAGGKASR